MVDSEVTITVKKSAAKSGKPKGTRPKKERPIKSDQATMYTLDAAVKKLRDKAPNAPNDGKRRA